MTDTGRCHGMPWDGLRGRAKIAPGPACHKPHPMDPPWHGTWKKGLESAALPAAPAWEVQGKITVEAGEPCVFFFS